MKKNQSYTYLIRFLATFHANNDSSETTNNTPDKARKNVPVFPVILEKIIGSVGRKNFFLFFF